MDIEEFLDRLRSASADTGTEMAGADEAGRAAVQAAIASDDPVKAMQTYGFLAPMSEIAQFDAIRRLKNSFGSRINLRLLNRFVKDEAARAQAVLAKLEAAKSGKREVIVFGRDFADIRADVLDAVRDWNRTQLLSTTWRGAKQADEAAGRAPW